jgi:transcription antitermination factor NusG
VNSPTAHLESIAQFSLHGCVHSRPRWYAVHTMPRHEKRVVRQVEEKSVCAFLPLLREVHDWSDRRRTVEVPMFSCYAFVQIKQTSEERMKVLQVAGVLGFVGSDRQGTPIPDEQIECLQTALREKIPCAVHPFIRIGQRVRIRGGSLNGMEGILAGQGSDRSLVISVELLQRSVAVRVAGYDIELAS